MAHTDDDPLVRLIRKAHVYPDDDAGGQKSSPLVDVSASRVPAPNRPPATQPLTATGAQGVGDQDVAPGQAVDALNRVVMHRHDGTLEGRTAYWHGHAHSEPINADQEDAGVVSYDNPRHLNDQRHRSANDRYEAKSVGRSTEDQIRAVRADSEWTQKAFMDDRNFHIRRLGQDRLDRNEGLISALSVAGELQKAARPTLTKRTRMTVTKRAPAAPTVRKTVSPEHAKRLKALDPVLALADEIVAHTRLLDHPDPTVRRGAQEVIAQKRTALEDFGRADVTKAVSWSGLTGEQVAKVVRKAVDQAMAELSTRIADLNRRSR